MIFISKELTLGMNKTLSLLLCCLLLCGHLRASQIDDLKTDKQVEDFVTSLDSVFTHKYSPPFRVADSTTVKDYTNPAKLPHVKKWQKVDLNADGRTDLLVMAQFENYHPYVVIDMGIITFN